MARSRLVVRLIRMQLADGAATLARALHWSTPPHMYVPMYRPSMYNVVRSWLIVISPSRSLVNPATRA